MKTAPSAACIGDPCPPRSEIPPTRTAAITSMFSPEKRLATARPNCDAAEMPASPQQTPNIVRATSEAWPTRSPVAFAVSRLAPINSSCRPKRVFWSTNQARMVRRMNAQLWVGMPSGRPVPIHRATSLANMMFWFWLTSDARPRKNAPNASVVMMGSAPLAMMPPWIAPAPPENTMVSSQRSSEAVFGAHQPGEDAGREDRQFLGREREQIPRERDVGHAERPRSR